jgi:hypothetical protein
MTGEGGLALGGGGAVMSPIDLNELGGTGDRVVLARGAAMAPMPGLDVEPPPRDVFVKDCASATIVDEPRTSAATTKAIR